MSRMGIFPKTFIYTISLLILVALVAHGLIFLLMPSFYHEQIEKELRSDITVIMEEIRKAEISEFADIISSAAESTGTYIELSYKDQLICSVNINVAASTGTEVDIIKKENYNVEIMNEPVSTDFFNGTSTSKDEISMQVPFTDQSNSYLLLKKTMQPLNDASKVIVSILPFSILICIILSAAFSLLYSRTLTRRIRKMSEATDNMIILDREARCDINGKDEIGVLGKNIDHLYSRLIRTIEDLEISYNKMCEAEQAKIDFLRSASHELKTPITAMNIMLENMVLDVGKYKEHQRYLPKVKEMAEQLGDMVHNILDASNRGGSAESTPPTHLNIAEIVECSLEPHMMMARNGGIKVECHIDESLQVFTNKDLIVKVFSNIISNAIYYNRQGGYVSIYNDGNNLVIENTGETISSEHLDHIFEPFYRPDFARKRSSGGNGLGLYIVDKLLSDLGFTYCFTPTADQDGMKFEIWF